MLFVWTKILTPPNDRKIRDSSSFKNKDENCRFNIFKPLVTSNRPDTIVFKNIDCIGNIEESTRKTVIVPKILSKILIFVSIDAPRWNVGDIEVLFLFVLCKEKRIRKPTNILANHNINRTRKPHIFMTNIGLKNKDIDNIFVISDSSIS